MYPGLHDLALSALLKLLKLWFHKMSTKSNRNTISNLHELKQKDWIHGKKKYISRSQSNVSKYNQHKTAEAQVQHFTFHTCGHLHDKEGSVPGIVSRKCKAVPFSIELASCLCVFEHFSKRNSKSISLAVSYLHGQLTGHYFTFLICFLHIFFLLALDLYFPLP